MAFPGGPVVKTLVLPLPGACVWSLVVRTKILPVLRSGPSPQEEKCSFVKDMFWQWQLHSFAFYSYFFKVKFKGTNILKLLLSTEKTISSTEVLHAELCPPKFLYWNPNPQNLMMWLHLESQMWLFVLVCSPALYSSLKTMSMLTAKNTT